MDFYRLNIIDHYKHPRNFGKIKSSNKSSAIENPSCGDSIEMDIVVKDNKIADIKFRGQGCALAIASASLLTEHVKGKSIGLIHKMNFLSMKKLLGIDVNNAREKCVMLSLEVLKEALGKI